LESKPPVAMRTAARKSQRRAALEREPKRISRPNKYHDLTAKQ